MNKKTIACIILILVIIGVLTFVTMRAPAPPDTAPSRGESESPEDLTQDHLDEALAELEYVDEEFLKP